jgi:hypothetical protein
MQALRRLRAWAKTEGSELAEAALREQVNRQGAGKPQRG